MGDNRLWSREANNNNIPYKDQLKYNNKTKTGPAIIMFQISKNDFTIVVNKIVIPNNADPIQLQ